MSLKFFKTSLFCFAFWGVLLGLNPAGTSRAEAAIAGDIPKQPEHSFVYDENRLLSAQDVAYFNTLSEELFQKTGVRMAVAFLDDMGYRESRNFAADIGSAWEIGGPGDKGILIFAALKQQRRTIQVGAHSASFFSESKLRSMEQNILVPQFRIQKYGEGITSLAYHLAESIAQSKSIQLDTPAPNLEQDSSMPLSHKIFISLVALFLIIAFRFRKGSTAKSSAQSLFRNDTFGGALNERSSFNGKF
ncbi:MAG: TPM domain-containing protein [Fibrobacter sp.]|nr:TPM domain-containing protein [Fibrobacter sp.]